MTEPDPHDPETGGASPDKPANIRKPRGIRFSDSEWEEVRTAAERNDVPVAEFVRERILEIARGRAAADISGIPADLAPLIERTFRYAWMLATRMRDDMINNGEQEALDKLVEDARKLHDDLLEQASR